MASIGSCRTDKCCVNDAICCDLTFTASMSSTVWMNSTNFSINGTILIENTSSTNDPLDVSLVVSNGGVTTVTVDAGECESVTLAELETISVDASGTGTDTATARVSATLNYCF
ncbi:DUF3992 domain-containing protein [Bacillus carboniphilus]|uniref:DUF3992 domain-containing protein n=1 Tax=Bacillus carboniphilus TaxID=86663 RepID=A0ABY9JRT7_9BACI|nr:S-Ena type endospore appendage [Bacillus carboniphilus]WLR42126.1 DUF3992 domain-containing protein [Bacillus carboniphilus]